MAGVFVRADLAQSPKHGTLAIGRKSEPAARFWTVSFFTRGNVVARILVACEESQEVAKAFRASGHEAWSCDLLPCSGGRPEWHIAGDVLDVLDQSWDAVIAFPPCTDLAASGARWFAEKQGDGRQQKAIEFFLRFTKLPCKWAIENPVGIMSRLYRKPDQIIQPWQYGEDASKATCLWLCGLPKLESTDVIKKDRYANQTNSGQNNLPPSKNRAAMRSKTYVGIARAMALQWGPLC